MIVLRLSFCVSFPAIARFLGFCFYTVFFNTAVNFLFVFDLLNFGFERLYCWIFLRKWSTDLWKSSRNVATKNGRSANNKYIFVLPLEISKEGNESVIEMRQRCVRLFNRFLLSLALRAFPSWFPISLWIRAILPSLNQIRLIFLMYAVCPGTL